VVLGSPLILSADVTSFTLEETKLITSKEILAVAGDADCTAGSLVTAFDSSEVWARPLHDQSFAVVLVNKGPLRANITVFVSEQYNYGDFYPAHVGAMHVRDLLDGVDIGVFSDVFTADVAARDARIFKFTPTL
jgi:hypothetical protein